MQRIVEQTDCGLVVQYRDQQTPASDPMKLYESPARREQMGQNGHNAVMERYNRDVSVYSLTEMYQEMKQERESRREDTSVPRQT